MLKQHIHGDTHYSFAWKSESIVKAFIEIRNMYIKSENNRNTHFLAWEEISEDDFYLSENAL